MARSWGPESHRNCVTTVMDTANRSEGDERKTKGYSVALFVRTAPWKEAGRIIESPFINVKWKINSHSVILLSGLACRVIEKRAERTPPSYHEGGLHLSISLYREEPGDYVASTSSDFRRSHPNGHHARNAAPQPCGPYPGGRRQGSGCRARDADPAFRHQAEHVAGRVPDCSRWCSGTIWRRTRQIWLAAKNADRTLCPVQRFCFDA